MPSCNTYHLTWVSLTLDEGCLLTTAIPDLQWPSCACAATTPWVAPIQVSAPTSNAEEAEVERFYEDVQDLLELTPKKDVLFVIGDWNAKVGSQETPGVTGKFGLGMQNEAEQRLIRVLPRKCTGHSKHPLPTTQEKTLHMDITRWSTPKSG